MNVTSHNAARPVRQRFSQLLRFAASGTIKVIDVSPVVATSVSFFGTQASNMANQFSEFRLNGLSVYLMPFQELPSSTGNVQTLMMMAYVPQVQAAGPGSVSDISNLSDVAVQVSGCTQPMKFHLSKRQLWAGKIVKWLHTDVTPNPETGMQGQIVYASLGTNSGTAEQTWLVVSDWEFRGPVPFGEYLKRINRGEIKEALRASILDKWEEPGHDEEDKSTQVGPTEASPPHRSHSPASSLSVELVEDIPPSASRKKSAGKGVV